MTGSAGQRQMMPPPPPASAPPAGSSGGAAQSCEGATCGWPGTVRELRAWFDAFGFTRLEFYLLVAFLVAAVLVGLYIRYYSAIARARNERLRIELENARQDRVAQAAIDKQRSKGRRR